MFALVGLLVATRWALAPKYLFYFDNINFALALDDFNPLKHQPQPPGYPLFVGLEKLVHAVVSSVKYTQLIAGTIGSALALIFLHRLGNLLFGRPAGLLATALFAFNPVFWLAGIGNHTRTFLAAGACGLAVCVWRARTADAPVRWYMASAVMFGAAAGFRPELLVLLFPLWISTAVRRRLGLRVLLGGMGVLVLSMLPWAVAMMHAMGGAGVLVHAFGPYFAFHTAKSSALLGGPASRAFAMGVVAIYWTGIGILTWIWAIPLAWRRMDLGAIREQIAFLAVWFVPPFIFYVLVHSDDPDHMLDIIPVTCLAGAWVLARLAETRTQTIALAAAGAAVNILLFFAPPYHLGKEAAYRYVKRTGDSLTAAVEGIRQIRGSGPVVVVVYRTYVTGHQIGYYFPSDPIVVTDTDFSKGCPAGSANLILHNQPVPLRMDSDTIHLPAAAHAALLLSKDSPAVSGARFEQWGPLLVADAVPPEFRIGACRFLAR